MIETKLEIRKGMRNLKDKLEPLYPIELIPYYAPSANQVYTDIQWGILLMIWRRILLPINRQLK